MGDAAKRVNQLCEELGIPPQNPAISALPNQQYQKKEKTSQYKGVYWHRKRKKWGAWLSLKNGKKKFGGNFKDELDAAKKVNQLCEQLGISPTQNSGVVEIPTQVLPHDDAKTIANAVICTEILKTDNDDININKRKREKNIHDDDKLPVKGHYFYDYLLK